MSGLSCRFYQHRLPEVTDAVMVKVKSIDGMSAYASLLEYNNIEGMILFTELSRQRIRSINKLIRVGRNECVQVINVDNEKDIDLSKRRVTPEDAARCEDKFTKSKTVYSILQHVAEMLQYTKDEELESLFQRTAWVFDKKYKRPGYGAYDVFKQAGSDPSILDGLDLTERERNVLIDNIKTRLTPQAVKIRADIEVQCYEYEGIDAIKDALRAGRAFSTEAMPININLIAPPRFMMTTTTLEHTEGVSVLDQAMAAIKEKIEEKKGIFNNPMKPKVVTETDEIKLARQLESLEEDNADEVVARQLESLEKDNADEVVAQQLESLEEENADEVVAQQLESLEEKNADEVVAQQLESLEEENADEVVAQQLESLEEENAEVDVNYDAEEMVAKLATLSSTKD